MCYVVDITSAGAGVVSLYSLPSFLSPAPSLLQLTADGARPLLHSGSGDSGALLSLALLSTVATRSWLLQ